MSKLSRIEQNKLSPEEREAYRAQRKIEQLAYRKEWRKKNATRYYELQRERRKENPDRTKNEQIRSRVKNAQKIRDYAKAYALKNPHKIKARFARYFQKNQAVRYEEWGWRDALRRGCQVGDRTLIVPIYQRAIDLTKETGERWSVDHIIPLAMGGHHRVENMQAMPLALNHTKSGNPFWIYENHEFKDWRDVPVEFWPKRFVDTFRTVAAHASHLFVEVKTA